VQREVADTEHVVRTKARVESSRVSGRETIAIDTTQARVSLVAGTAVRPCIEVAGSAGSFAVAAKLHFPEECLAQGDSCVLVFNYVC
jgi:hypothetical protein